MPTLHFYRRDPPAISVGYFRSVYDDVDLEQCTDLGIKIVRRSSGGGTIYTDRNQLILGIISRHMLGTDIKDSFKRVCQVLITALDKLGIPAAFKSPNDIVINGKKISGSAQLKKKNAHIIHSTLILGLDYDIIERVLKNPKPGYTSSIQDECGYLPDIEELKSMILGAFHEYFGFTFEPGQVSKLEKDLIQELLEKKYSTHDWNFKR